MKIRNGFVSNSSSSSFIIETKENIPCKVCGRKDEDIIDVLKNITENNDSGIEASGKEDVLEYVSDWLDNNKIIEEIKNAKGEVYCISISYHDEILNKLLQSSKSIRIIYGEN